MASSKEQYVDRFIADNYNIKSYNTDYALEQILPGVCNAFNASTPQPTYQQSAPNNPVFAQFREMVEVRLAGKRLMQSIFKGEEVCWHAMDGDRQVGMGKTGRMVTMSTRTTNNGSKVHKVIEHSTRNTVKHYFTSLNHDNL